MVSNRLFFHSKKSPDVFDFINHFLSKVEFTLIYIGLSFTRHQEGFLLFR